MSAHRPLYVEVDFEAVRADVELAELDAHRAKLGWKTPIEALILRVENELASMGSASAGRHRAIALIKAHVAQERVARMLAGD